MPENRDFAWLRKTLCDEIEAVRSGTADHARAKSVAALAAAALKSVEVEAMVRQQHVEFIGVDAPELGALPLCAYEIPVFVPPAVEVTPVVKPDEPVVPAPQRTKQPEHDITEVGGFKVGDRVVCPNKALGTITKVTTAGRIEVKEDTGGMFPYSARHLQHAVEVERPLITSPVVPNGAARFVAGRSMTGSR